MYGDAPALTDWPDLRRALDESYGVIIIRVEALREIASEGRRTRMDAVRNKIIERLDNMGVSYWPDIPMKAQGATVILYQRGTEADELLRAIESEEATPKVLQMLQMLNRFGVPGDEVQAARFYLDLTRDLMTRIFEPPETKRRRRRRT